MTTATRIDIDNPFKGLAAFDASDADASMFFGRDHDRHVLVANLRAAQLTVLLGPSGVGKSSLLRAGVVHELVAAHEAGQGGGVAFCGTWVGDPVQAVVRAIDESCGGIGPVAGLADASSAGVARAGAPLYIVLDQIEELFLYHDPTELGEQLARTLDRRGDTVTVLVAVRDDALAQLEAWRRFMPQLLDNVLRLTPLTVLDARAAIVGPVDRYNDLVAADARITIEPELIEAVIEQVSARRRGRETVREDDSVAAPYLQLVLDRLWRLERKRGSRVLRRTTLDQLGGAREVVRDHFEAALAALDDDGRKIAAGVLGQLVTPSGSKIAHRIDDLAELSGASAGEVSVTVEALVAQRVLRRTEPDADGGERVEIHHDVLGPVIQQWQASWRLRREQQQRMRDRRRFRITAAGSIGVAALFAAIALYALVQRHDARDQARRAQSRELAARALAGTTTDPVRSLAFAVRAAQLEPGSDTQGVLRSVLAQQHELAKITSSGRAVASGALLADTLTSDGSALVVGAAGRLYTVNTDGHVTQRDIGEPGMRAAAFSGDTRLVALVLSSGVAQVVDVTTGQVIVRHLTPGASGVAFSPNGRRVIVVGDGRVDVVSIALPASFVALHVPGVVSARSDAAGTRIAVMLKLGSGDRRAVLVDARTGAKPVILAGDGINGVAFSPDGKLLATFSDDHTARVFNTSTGLLQHVLQHQGHVNQGAFSADGTMLVTASGDGAARVWSTATWQRELLLVGPSGPVDFATFSGDGRFVLVGSDDTTARVYSAVNGAQLALLAGHHGAVFDGSLSYDGSTAITRGADNSVRLWNPGVADQLREFGDTFVAHDTPIAISVTRHLRRTATVFGTGEVRIVERRPQAPAPTATEWHAAGTPIRAATFDQAGNRVLIARTIGAELWDVDTHRVVAALDRGDSVTFVALSARGTWALLGTSRNDVRLVDVNRGSTRHIWHRYIRLGAVAPDGRTVIFVRGNDAYLYDASGRSIATLRGHTRPVTSVSFSPDGHVVATTSIDHDTRLWSASTGQLLHVLRGHFGPVSSAAFSSDSAWLATAGPGTVGLWNILTGSLFAYLRGTNGHVDGVTFAPDEMTVVSWGSDRVVRSYECQLCGGLSDLLDLARSRLRSLDS